MVERLIDKLSEEYVDELLFEEYPFQTEICSECSHFRWGSWGKLKVKEDSDGEIPCCSDEKTIWEMDVNPSSNQLTAENALDYYSLKGHGHLCLRYDGDLPHTLEEIQEWTKNKKQIIKEIGFEPGKYFKDNIELGKLVDTSKMIFGNEECIEFVQGKKKISADLMCPYKIAAKLKEASPHMKGYCFPDSLYSLALKKYEMSAKIKDYKSLNALSEGIAKYLTGLNAWTMENYSLGQSVLYRIVRKDELKRWEKAIKESFRNPNGKVVWYQDLHKFIYKDDNRKNLVKDLCNCLAGVSCSIAES